LKGSFFNGAPGAKAKLLRLESNGLSVYEHSSACRQTGA